MPSFHLTVALRIVGAGTHMAHAALADEGLEVSGHELRPIIGDNPGFDLRKAFPGALQI